SWQRLATLLGTPLPDMARRLWSPALVELAAEVIATARVRLVQAEGLEVAGMALAAAARARPRLQGQQVPVLFDDHNAEWVLQRSAGLVDLRQPMRWGRMLYSLVQWQRLRRYEAALIRAAALTSAVSPDDAHVLSRLAGRPVRVVPNGIKVAAWRSVDRQQVEPGTLLFTGKLDYRPNVDALCWFCAEVLALVRAQHPAVRLLIVGRDPAPAVRALAGPDVTVVGEVPEVQSYFSRAAVYVIPMRMGSGARIKLLEAWAAGVPVVATEAGAAGLAGLDGEHLLLGDDPETLAAQIGRLLENPALGHRLAAAGRTLVGARYDWSVIWPQMAECYRELCHRQ
ncbi:MAG: glycosyl transferase family 1, partial [Dehalococcoidia bacterium]|nr:glycosyl transferase family 1 [Dehalococcoidia bacterium]